jgi:hypothetical protein
MKTWRCVFADGAESLILARDKATAILSAAELYGSNPVNVFLEDEW